MTTRDIQAHVCELDGIAVSPDRVSTVTDAVHDAVKVWQQRPLESTCAMVFFDALRVKIRERHSMRLKPANGARSTPTLCIAGVAIGNA